MIDILSNRIALHLLLTVSLALQPLAARQAFEGACARFDRQASDCGGCGCCVVERPERRCGCCSDHAAPTASAADACEAHRPPGADRSDDATPPMCCATAVVPASVPAEGKPSLRVGCQCGQLPQPMDERAPLSRSIEHRVDAPAFGVHEGLCDGRLSGNVVRCGESPPTRSLARFSQRLLCVWRL